KAAFDFAVDKDQLDQWGQMLSFATEVTKNEQMNELLKGSVSADKLAEIFVAVCGEQVDAHGQNLIKVMAENGRLTALPDVCEQFFLLKKEHEKEIDVEVISASELSDEQLANIGSKLEVRLERKVKLNCSVDETLLGGVIIRAGDLVIDNSARGRLNRLSDALQS
ncbi:F0F1 ATP synthase subunit delta, partial [Vibrio campbellii]